MNERIAKLFEENQRLHETIAMLRSALVATRQAILDSIHTKISMNNMKYDDVAKQVLDALDDTSASTQTSDKPKSKRKAGRSA